MSKIYFPILVLFVALAAFGCTRNDAQRDFEQEAYRAPNAFTETSPQGEILSLDGDDWRISPLFQGLIEIVPPFPNPSNTTSAIQFEVEVTGVQSVTGLEVIVFFDNFDPREGSNVLYFITETLQPGLTTFQINPLELGESPVPESARGLHRVHIFDGRGQLISYGDIMIE
ncbi:MAG: hypothetical protein WD016_11860 [Balneolaceae bacterium]